MLAEINEALGGLSDSSLPRSAALGFHMPIEIYTQRLFIGAIQHLHIYLHLKPPACLETSSSVYRKLEASSGSACSQPGCCSNGIDAAPSNIFYKYDQYRQHRHLDRTYILTYSGLPGLSSFEYLTIFSNSHCGHSSNRFCFFQTCIEPFCSSTLHFL